MMEKHIQKICDEIVRKYTQDKNVMGILLFGSAVRNAMDRYSDIDIYILLDKKGRSSRKNFTSDGVRVDIIFNTKKEARKYLDEEVGNVRRNTSHMLADGKILLQRGDHMTELQNHAKENLQLKTQYTKSEVLMHLYSIDDFWSEIQRDREKGNLIAFGLDSQLLLQNILELFLKVHGEFFHQSNQMGEILERLDPTFANYMRSFYEEHNLQEKNAILGELIGYIYKKSGGPIPQSWSI